jgi:hypothetical protein
VSEAVSEQRASPLRMQVLSSCRRGKEGRSNGAPPGGEEGGLRGKVLSTANGNEEGTRSAPRRVKPRASSRPIKVPISPRWTVSGLSKTSDCSIVSLIRSNRHPSATPSPLRFSRISRASQPDQNLMAGQMPMMVCAMCHVQCLRSCARSVGSGLNAARGHATLTTHEMRE